MSTRTSDFAIRYDQSDPTHGCTRQHTPKCNASTALAASILLKLIIFILLYGQNLTKMVKTSAEHEADIKHVFDNVMRLHQGTRLPDAVQYRNIVTVDDMIALPMKSIDEMKYKDDVENKVLSLNTGDRQILKIFITYVHKLNEEDRLPDEWTDIDHKDFRRYHLSPEPITRIQCMYNGQDYQDVMAASRAALTQTTATTTGAPSTMGTAMASSL